MSSMELNLKYPLISIRTAFHVSDLGGQFHSTFSQPNCRLVQMLEALKPKPFKREKNGAV